MEQFESNCRPFSFFPGLHLWQGCITKQSACEGRPACSSGEGTTAFVCAWEKPPWLLESFLSTLKVFEWEAGARARATSLHQGLAFTHALLFLCLLLNWQRFVEVDLCWPLHARLAYYSLSLSVDSLSARPNWLNAAYAKQSHSTKKCLEPFLVFAMLHS